MKEYKGCKYFSVEEVKNRVGTEDITVPNISVLVPIGEVTVPYLTNEKIEVLDTVENPEEFLEELSKKTIDQFVKSRS